MLKMSTLSRSRKKTQEKSRGRYRRREEKGVYRLGRGNRPEGGKTPPMASNTLIFLHANLLIQGLNWNAGGKRRN